MKMKKGNILSILFLISLISVTGCATKYHYVNYPYRHRLNIDYPYPTTVYYYYDYEPVYLWPSDIVLFDGWYYWDCDDPPAGKSANPQRRENLRERLETRRSK